jgi:hypothetical protein
MLPQSAESHWPVWRILVRWGWPFTTEFITI